MDPNNQSMPVTTSAPRDVERLLTLNLTEGIGVVLYRRLVRHFGALEAAVAAPERALREVPGIGPVLAGAIRKHARAGTGRAEIDRAARLGVRVLPFWDEAYPAVLKPLYDPPLVLYVKGTLAPEDALAVAVVGTRVPSFYGRAQAERFARQLAARGITVVSGLARGVDTHAHEAALKAGGRTVAVLGSGLQRVYPPENAKLAARVAEQGALVSEFSLAASPNPKNFPRRNRIISGLSLGVLVVEAGRRSGALITVDWALEQGREVFAVPGKIDNPESAGCHAILKQGAAKLVESVEDILEEIPAYAAAQPAGGPGRGGAAGRGNGGAAEPRGTIGAASALARTGDGRASELLALLGGEPLHIDALIAESGLPSSAVSAALLGLELKRLVKQLPGKYFVRA